MVDMPQGDDAASQVKARRSRGTPRGAAEPVPPDPAPVDSSPGVPAMPSASSGISHHSLGGPATVVSSFVSEGVPASVAGNYVVPDQPGFYSFYPRGARQPSTVRVWNAGQQVRRDVYERYGGPNTPSRPENAQPINEVADGLVVQH